MSDEKFYAALTKWADHYEWYNVLMQRYKHVWWTLEFPVCFYRVSRPSVFPDNFHAKTFSNLMSGITHFPRKMYWQYPVIFSPNILEREGDWYQYDNIFFWEKEEVAELLDLKIDVESFRVPFTRPSPKELVEFAHDCLLLSEKSFVRYTPEVHVIIYRDGNAYFCDKDKNRINLPEYITIKVDDIDGVYRITVSFLHIKKTFWKTWRNAKEYEFPAMFRHPYVYNVVDTDSLIDKDS